MYNVAAQLLSMEKGVDARPAFARTHLADGYWLALQAARLSADRRPDDQAATIVVTIEEASASVKTNCLACLPLAAMHDRWHGRYRCLSTPSRTISSRSLPKPPLTIS